MRKKSALAFVLKGLIPYSRENLLLSFKPNLFFNELEKSSGYNRTTLKHAYWRSKKQKLVAERGGIPKLTRKGLNHVRPFMAVKLKNAQLMVIFDIPETVAGHRRRFRSLLKELEFKQIQKSVWSTEYDHKMALEEAISEMKISGYVELYEAARLFPKT